jgi:hypothetical protein
VLTYYFEAMLGRRPSVLDIFRPIREFEHKNHVPPCFLICLNMPRAAEMSRINAQEIMDCGVDFITPWYQVLPLYDALAGREKGPEWHDKPGALTKVDVLENVTDLEAAVYVEEYPDKCQNKIRLAHWPIPESLGGSTVLFADLSKAVNVGVHQYPGSYLLTPL